jgi:hypothetical protein
MAQLGDAAAWMAGESAASITKYASLTPLQKTLGL